jgi:uncharacterized protein YecT (DUF1311 family)
MASISSYLLRQFTTMHKRLSCLLALSVCFPFYFGCSERQVPKNVDGATERDNGGLTITLVDFGSGKPPAHISSALAKHLTRSFSLCEGYPTSDVKGQGTLQYDRLIAGANTFALGAADNLNKVTWRGSVFIHGAAWRYFDSKTQRFSAWENTDLSAFKSGLIPTGMLHPFIAEYQSGTWNFGDVQTWQTPSLLGKCPGTPEKVPTSTVDQPAAPQEITPPPLVTNASSATEIKQQEGSPTPSAVPDANDCSRINSEKTSEMLECLKSQLAIAAADLNIAYKSKVSGLATARQTEWRDSQRKWLSEMKNRCDSVAGSAGLGVTKTIATANCALSSTRERTLEIQAL